MSLFVKACSSHLHAAASISQLNSHSRGELHGTEAGHPPTPPFSPSGLICAQLWARKEIRDFQSQMWSDIRQSCAILRVFFLDYDLFSTSDLLSM